MSDVKKSEKITAREANDCRNLMVKMSAVFMKRKMTRTERKVLFETVHHVDCFLKTVAKEAKI